MSLITNQDETAQGRDQHGVPVSADSDTIALYDQAIDRLLRYHTEVVDLAGRLVEQHSEAAASHILMGYLCLMSTDQPDVDAARASLDALRALPVNERERAHRGAIDAWIAGDWNATSAWLDDILVQWPTDLLALQIGHQLDFFLGDQANLRDRPGRSLPAMDPRHPHTAFVRGMQSFGLEEAGHYEQAEEAGLAALDTNPDDVWAVHAVVHSHEMRGQVDQGIDFLDARAADWTTDNLFTVHNWWHLALFHLEAGAIDEVLRIYDAAVHNQDSAGVPLEMLDASALLWRLMLDGHDTGARWSALADAWASRTELESWYVFNDLHAAMALVGAGRMADAEQLADRLAGYAGRGGPGTNVSMTAQIGLPASRAVIHFAQGRHDDVVAELMPIRRVLSRFGGSHAQRDVLQRTLLESCLRSGRTDQARALVAERLSVRGTSVYGWTQQARLLRALDRQAEADQAEQSANRFQATFATASAAARR